MNELRYLGHSAFFIKNGEYGILIDPFISQNPSVKFDVRDTQITHIFLTHGHGDHFGDALAIAQVTGAVIVAVFELANYCQARGVNTIPVALGGEIKFEWGSSWFLPAFHSSSTPDGHYAGCAASILFDIGGVRIFHAGDTAMNTEMKLIGDFYKPYYALLPIGGHFTMGIPEALYAAKMLNAKEIIPMHYNTFDAIKVDVISFITALEEQGQKGIILKANESIDI